HWIVCGYGRFGKAICERLEDEGIRVVIVEAHPERTGQPPQGLVVGRGTEADTLIEADIEHAAGLVAGTDNDANNLSIVMTAREINDRVFVVVRQNHRDNHDIIAAVDADMVMHPSAIIAEKIRVLLATPMLYEFMSLALYQEDSWACELVSRVTALVGDEVPHVREWQLDDKEAGALCEYLEQGGHFLISDLMRNPWQRDLSLRAIVLLIRRRNDRLLLPAPNTPIRAGDRLLLCGDLKAFTRMQWSVSHRHTLDFIKTGEDKPQGWLWRRLSKHFNK
ncbi:MAG: TrkA family potassium uptake protein, partial [Gammaproteobacteria bacterium]|nr:TrkA family potassium uptake protein [Gammaproteobacteria bacterium]